MRTRDLGTCGVVVGALAMRRRPASESGQVAIGAGEARERVGTPAVVSDGDGSRSVGVIVLVIVRIRVARRMADMSLRRSAIPRRGVQIVTSEDARPSRRTRFAAFSAVAGRVAGEVEAWCVAVLVRGRRRVSVIDRGFSRARKRRRRTITGLGVDVCSHGPQTKSYGNQAVSHIPGRRTYVSASLFAVELEGIGRAARSSSRI